VVLVVPVSVKFSSSQRKCDVAPESITNFRVDCFTFSDLCLPPGLFLDFFSILLFLFCLFLVGVLPLLRLHPLLRLEGSNSF
jgi:hypothetical protein